MKFEQITEEEAAKLINNIRLFFEGETADEDLNHLLQETELNNICKLL